MRTSAPTGTALLARGWGLPWTSTTVSHIENGTRALSVEELVLLPAVLEMKLPKLFEPDQPVALGPEGSLPWSVVAKVLAGRALPGDPAKIMLPARDALQVVLPRLLKRVREIQQLWPDATLEQVRDAESAAERVAERKAAANVRSPSKGPVNRGLPTLGRRPHRRTGPASPGQGGRGHPRAVSSGHQGANHQGTARGAPTARQ